MRTPAALFLLALAAVACAPEGEGDTPADVATQEVTLRFDAVVGTDAAACGTDYAFGDGIAGQLADARLFVSSVELRDADGTWRPMTLDQDTVWQHQGVALLDFEDGTAACADSGTAEQNAVVVGTLPEGSYDAVRFDVGVPFELNHVDNATAPAPLNAPGMFWVWQGGYKFVRVDFSVPGETTPRWNVHIGSTGCDSASPITPPDEECGRPNRARIQIEGFDPAADRVAIDLAALVATADLTADVVDSPPGCMSNPVEGDDCGEVFASLGLDFATGDCTTDCSDQTVFAR